MAQGAIEDQRYLLAQREYQFKMWAQNSLLQQVRHGVADAYDPDQDVYTIRIDQTQLNSMLATKPMGDLREPRVVVTSDRIELGGQLDVNKWCFVVSTAVRPAIQDGQLRFEIETVRLGQLPIPLSTIASKLQGLGVYHSREFHINLTAPRPFIAIDLPVGNQRAARCKSIRCEDQAIVVELLPPLLNPPQQSVALAK